MADPSATPVPTEYGAIQADETRSATAPGPRRSPRDAGERPPGRGDVARQDARQDTVVLPTTPPAPPPGVPLVEAEPPGRRPRRQAEGTGGSDDTAEVVPARGWRRERVRVVRGRRSRRIVRRLDAWTVLKVSLVFYLCAVVVVMVAGVVLWNVAEAFGFLHTIEKSIRTLFDYKAFILHPGPILEYAVVIGVILAIVGTLANVLLALLYNLISDVVGGIQIVVIAEEG